MSGAKRQLEEQMADDDHRRHVLTELYGPCARCQEDVDEDFEGIEDSTGVDLGNLAFNDIEDFKKREDVAPFLGGSHYCSYCDHMMNKDD